MSGYAPSVNPFDDLEALRRDGEDWRCSLEPIKEIEVETEVLRRKRDGYIRGPLPLPEVIAAGRLPGKALLVWLFLRHRMRMTGQDEVTLPNGLVEVGGVDRNAKARALLELERAGLIHVTRAPGRTPRISLVTPLTRRAGRERRNERR
jgi:hypothetical protein